MQEVATHTDYKALYEESQFVITQLRHELDQLKKMIFGSRQERFIPGQSNDCIFLPIVTTRSRDVDHLFLGC